MPHPLTTTRIVATFVFLMGAASNVAGQMFIATGRDTLRGLAGVEVLVEAPEQDVERDGLGRVAIQADVERWLRARGITVYTSQSANPSDAKAYLYVHVNSLKLARQNLYVIAVQVQLRQTLRSLVTSSNIVDAMTWDSHDVLAVPIDKIESVRESIKEYVDQFIRDWIVVHE